MWEKYLGLWYTDFNCLAHGAMEIYVNDVYQQQTASWIKRVSGVNWDRPVKSWKWSFINWDGFFFCASSLSILLVGQGPSTCTVVGSNEATFEGLLRMTMFACYCSLIVSCSC